MRLLRAAKKFGIVPVGFINNQLRSERALGEAHTADVEAMPTGFVTMLMSDIEKSTALLDRLGDRYGDLLGVVRERQRSAATEFDGRVVEERADEFFAVFESPRSRSNQPSPRSAPSTPIRGTTTSWCVSGRNPRRISDRQRGELHRHGRPHHGAGVRRCPRWADRDLRRHPYRAGGASYPTDPAPQARLVRLRGIPKQHTLFQLGAPGLARRFPDLRT